MIELTPWIDTPAALASACALVFASAIAAVRAWASAFVSSSTRNVTLSRLVAPAARASSIASPRTSSLRTVTVRLLENWYPMSRGAAPFE